MHINREGHASGSARSGTYREERIPILPPRVRASHWHVLRNLHQNALGQDRQSKKGESTLVRHLNQDTLGQEGKVEAARQQAESAMVPVLSMSRT